MFGTVFEKTANKNVFMKNLLSLLFIVVLSNLSLAQPPEYDDLKILYADADYEKLAKVAGSYTEKDNTKKDILPYIWLGKGLYKISLSGTTDEKFKNAYKDAIKYLKKGMRYDLKYNDGAVFAEHEEFLNKFQMSLVEIIDNEVAAESYRRAFGWAHVNTATWINLLLELIGKKQIKHLTL